VLTALRLIGVVALIAATGYFVAVEFAFVTARRTRFAIRAGEGDRRSKRAVEVHKRLSLMVSGMQLGVTVSTLVLGFIAEPALGVVIRPSLEAVGVPDAVGSGLALALALVVITIAQTVFGELVPKNLAIARPEPLVRALAPSAWLFLRMAGPLIRLFDRTARWFLRLVGVKPLEELYEVMSNEELDLIVDSSAESGHLTALQAALLERAIDFGQLDASDAMVPWNRVVTIQATASASDLRDLMASTHSRFPVIDDDGKVSGIVHAKDLLGVDRTAYDEIRMDALAREILAVPEAARLTVVLADLRSHSTEMAVVIDEYGGSAGVVTLEDIIEELVGDIEDEYDPSAPGEHVETAPGVWSVAASSRPDEIERITGFDLPDGDYDTAAGLVLDRLERIPDEGDSFVIDGIRIKVIRVDGFAIERLELCVDPDARSAVHDPATYADGCSTSVAS
jgi:CBS domain containing-hemolysin-like protein